MTSTIPSKATPHCVEKESLITAGTIPEGEQITIADTGWSEEEKERMRRAGYDGMDIIQAWYS